MWIWAKNAWQGWQQFITLGKLPALLIAVLLWMLSCHGRQEASGGDRPWQNSGAKKGVKDQLLYYGAAMTAFCICPGTAALLMKYQTAFYDYRFVWSLVPMTALLGLGGTLFFTRYWRSSGIGLGYKSLFYNAALTFSCAAILFFSGGLGRGEAVPDTAAEREKAFQVLAQVEDLARGQSREIDPGGQQEAELCLWAPREIITYARLENGSFTLLYGRNMWDVALNAYSYDVYPEEVRRLYCWMEDIPVEGEAGKAEEARAEQNAEQLRRYVEKAFSLGANCVLLPKEYADGVDVLAAGAGAADQVEMAASGLSAEVFELEDYILFFPRRL